MIAKDSTITLARSMEFGVNLSYDLIVVPKNRPFASPSPVSKWGLKWNTQFGYAGEVPEVIYFNGKAWVDGENDARTGLMCSPYLGHKETDPAGGRGSQVTSAEQALRLAKIAQKNGVICMLHCSGDKAMAIGMTTYEDHRCRECCFRAKLTGMKID